MGVEDQKRGIFSDQLEKQKINFEKIKNPENKKSLVFKKKILFSLFMRH